MALRLFPFNSGIENSVDIRLLPDGLLADAVNVELDRQGRLVVRPGYTAIAATVFGSGTLVTYDLFAMNDRLFAFGDAHSYGFPCDIYELLPAGTAARWRPTSANNTLSPRLPRATKVREIARPPDQADGVKSWGCAAFGGFACLVYDQAVEIWSSVHVVRAADDQSLTIELLPQLMSRVVAVSDRFLILSLTTVGDSMGLDRFIPASDEALVDVASNLFSGAAITRYASATAAGSDDFAVTCQLGTNLVTRLFSSTGTLIRTYSTIAVTTTAVAIDASATANQVVIGYVVAGAATFVAYNLTTGATLATRAGSFTGAGTVVNVGVARISSSQVVICASLTGGSDPEPFVRKFPWTPATDTQGGGDDLKDAKMVSVPFFDDELMFAIQYGDATVGGTPNMLLSIGSDAGQVTPQIAKDLEVADTTSVLPPEIALDASTGKYYWANATANPDGTTTPQLTEFELSSTDRRQVAVLGNLAYIAGGVPLVFDARSVVESGFIVRPRIISLTGSNGAGELLGAATYRYRLHWEWIDSENNLHLSPPSSIESVTLGASDDTVTAVCSAPHSMRSNDGAGALGGSHALVLSRTLATVTNTAAELVGTLSLDPPATVLNGLTLNVLTTVAGTPDFDSVTFGAGDTSSGAIVATINAAFSGATATAPGGFLVLTHDTPGENNVLFPPSGTAASALGFGTASDEGTTTRTTGENFQRSAVVYTPVFGASGEYQTIVDVRKDESDPIEDDDLIRQQPLYSSGNTSGAHFAPPPNEYMWAGRERIIANHPRRSRFVASKLIVPSEPAEFAAEGFIGFQGQVTGDIEGIVVLGDSNVEWTRREIWEVSGSGPARNGIGEFFAARRISNAGGLVADGWRSLCETDEGVFFQRQTNQLCMLSKSGTVSWIGQAIEDYLDLYPEIVASVYMPSKHSVAFAVRSSDGSTGGIIRHDLQAKAWFFDPVGAVASMAEFQGRLAYIQGGIVFLQDAEPGTGAVPTYSVKTNMFQGFDAVGYGQLNRIGALLTYQGPCTLNLYLSDDGVDYTTLIATWPLTDADYDPGQRVVLLKDPPAQMKDSFSLKFEVTGTTDSEGVWLHAVAVDVEKVPEHARKGTRFNL